MKKINFYSFFFLLIMMGCFSEKEEAREIVKPEFQKYFDAFGLEGTFVLFDQNENTYIYVNPAQKDQAYIPASTFKIINSLIGLETGVIEDENFVILWDGVERMVKSWNQDQTLASALKYSAVWYYQELARRVGREKMEKWINKAEYGNKKTGPEIDMFWLRGDIRISPAQQIEFLKRLYKNELPFSVRNMEIVKKIMIVEETEAYTMHAKTGWSLKQGVGWYVGYVETNDNVYFFSTCVQGDDYNSENFGRSRIKISWQILTDLGVLPDGE